MHAPKSLTVLQSDTRLELSPLWATAQQIMSEARQRGHDARVVLPAIDDRFFVYMLGRGVPPPSNTSRWCTASLITYLVTKKDSLYMTCVHIQDCGLVAG